MERARRRAEEVLFHQPSVEGILARREARRSRPADAGLAIALAGELKAAQSQDGSWGGNLLRSAQALLRLRDLEPGAAAAASAVSRGLSWLRGRQGAPGRYGDGCDPSAHGVGVCHHFLAGFFAPCPPEDTLAAIRLDCGAPVEGEPDTRVAASCVALRALLAWGEWGSELSLHVDGLCRIAGLWRRWAEGLLSPPAHLTVVRALLDAPASAQRETAARHGLGLMLRAQRADGTWPDVDVFLVLDVLHAAQASQHDDNRMGDAVRRAAGLLAVSQQEDGSWGSEDMPRRTLIGWRALRAAMLAG